VAQALQITRQPEAMRLHFIQEETAMIRRLMMFAGALVAGAALAGCSTNPSPTVVSIAVTGAAPAVGGTSQFKAVATFSDGTTKDVTSSTEVTAVTTWLSGNTAVATVSSTGVVTGVSVGSVTIQVSYLAVTGNETIQITG
jgi:hypothetical protein